MTLMQICAAQTLLEIKFKNKKNKNNMEKKTKIIIGVGAAMVVAVGGFAFYKSMNKKTATKSQTLVEKLNIPEEPKTVGQSMVAKAADKLGPVAEKVEKVAGRVKEVLGAASNRNANGEYQNADGTTVTYQLGYPLEVANQIFY